MVWSGALTHPLCCGATEADEVFRRIEGFMKGKKNQLTSDESSTRTARCDRRRFKKHGLGGGLICVLLISELYGQCKNPVIAGRMCKTWQSLPLTEEKFSRSAVCWVVGGFSKKGQRPYRGVFMLVFTQTVATLNQSSIC